MNETHRCGAAALGQDRPLVVKSSSTPVKEKKIQSSIAEFKEKECCEISSIRPINSQFMKIKTGRAKVFFVYLQTPSSETLINYSTIMKGNLQLDTQCSPLTRESEL